MSASETFIRGEEQMRKLLAALIAVAAAYCAFQVLALAQQTQNSTNSSTASSASGHDFLTKAIESNVAEIELAKLAQSKSENSRVKEFAAMMVKDHSGALNRLRQAEGAVGPSNDKSRESAPGSAPTAGLVNPSKEHEQLKTRLAKLSGDEFDREYINAMVQEHQKDIQEFQSEANSRANETGTREKPAPGTEAQPQTVARELLPTLRMHLQQAQSLQKTIAAR
jgi:putative membrane protein